MKFHSLLIVVLASLPVCAFAYTGGTATDTSKQKKSVVLKEQPQLYFYDTRQDHATEDWDNFMLVSKANAGDAVAQHDLALCYLTGQRFFADTQKAVYWIKKSAEQNLVQARYNLGIMLNNGIGVAWDPFEAYRHFQYAAQHGMKEAEYVYGLLYTDNLIVARNYSEAYKWITKSADDGYSPAKDILSEFKKLGIHPAPDSQPSQSQSKKTKKISKSKAKSPPKPSGIQPVFIDFSSDSIHTPNVETLLKEAWEQHRTNAEENNETTASDTSGSVPDSVKIKTILKDAEANSPEALTLVGRWYEEGTILPRDIIQATIFYLRAVRCDSRWAPILLWNLTNSKNYFTSLKLRVDANDPAAKYVWAELVASGFDRQLTESQALTFLEQASQQGYIEATVELGIRYCSGTWLPPNRDEGKKLLKLAADAGNKEAQIRLWMIELDANQSMASSSLLDSLRRANDAGSVLAGAMLGYCYQKGIGVSTDISKSVYYYREAARRGSETAYSTLKEMYAALRPGDPEFKLGE